MPANTCKRRPSETSGAIRRSASAAAKWVFDAEHRPAAAQRAIVARAHHALVVGEAGAAEIRQQAHPKGVADLLVAQARPLPQLGRQHRRADRLAVRKIAGDVERQRQTAEKLGEPGERHAVGNLPRRVCCDARGALEFASASPNTPNGLLRSQPHAPDHRASSRHHTEAISDDDP